MSQSEEKAAANSSGIKLDGLFAFKQGMTTIYEDSGDMIPVTVLKYDPWVVSQIKTKEKDGYSAVQVACGAKKAGRSTKADNGQFKKIGFENGAQYVNEIRQEIPEGLTPGQKVSLDSLQKGDVVKICATSKGHGFCGVVKRWSFAGGPAAHGSKFHRRPGSVGNRTWPGRVMPGKRFPGHWGTDTVTLKNVTVVDIIPEENVILVKGPVPGARNNLVKLVKA